MGLKTSHIVFATPFNLSASHFVVANDAAADTKAWAKAAQDAGSNVYVCDGTADDVQIQAAIAALPSGGGKVVLSEGTFNVTAAVTISSNFVTIEGMGYSTIWKRTSGSDINLLSVSGQYDIARDIYFHGNKDAGDSPTTGNNLVITGATFLTVENIYSGYSPASGIYASNSTDKTVFWLNNIIVLASGGAGVDLKNVAGIYSKGLVISSSVTQGLKLTNVSESTFSSGVIDANTSYGIYLKSTTTAIHFDGNYIGGQGLQGVMLEGGQEGIVFANNTFRGNSAVALNVGDIYVNGATAKNTIISNNWFDNYDDRCDWAIYLAGAVGTITIQGNVFTSTSSNPYPAPIDTTTYTGTVNIIRDNQGYTTENSGTGTINSGATSAVITHELSYTPVAGDITITPTENPSNTPGLIWVDTITATQFTVNCENDPGASNLDFSWAVRKI